MTSQFEKLPVFSKEPEPIDEADQDIEDYEENLAAQHSDADKLLKEQKEEVLLKKHEEDIFDLMQKHRMEDIEDRKY
ncbi:MAG: hypothetical protein WCO55_03450 [Candidatus Falkowbacteria bacterium]